METTGHVNKIKKQQKKIEESIVRECDPSVTALVIDNKKNGKKYFVETISDEAIMRRRNSAYKFLM